ncbi:MAG: Inner rane protein translocase component YidC, long form [Labilithrix sp.]|nr:Inner rane protein translocase component YidC, long form [Labilithrix sp.]
MDRSSVLRWGVIAAAIILFWKFGMPLITGSNDKPQSAALADVRYAYAPDFQPDLVDAPAQPGVPNAKPDEGEICTLKGERYEAVTSSRGAAIVHMHATDKQYAEFDMSSTPDHERWRSLRTSFRGGDATSQIKYDRFPWKLVPGSDGKTCQYTYEDADVRIVKTLSTSTRPFEVNVDTVVTNLANEARRHQLTIGAYAYRLNSEIKGSLGRQSPLQTELSCAVGKDVTRKNKDDFKAGWFGVPGVDRYAAINSYYFSQALVPEPGEGAVTDAPTCNLLAEEWSAESAVYHADLVYPARELAPHASADYRQIAFFGPKERVVLAHAVGGRPKLGDVINLGFFAPVATVLIRLLDVIHDHVTFGNWGLAIIVMTIGLRSLLFPLTYKSIKTTIAMRRLKPEVDAVNAKFADDAQAKNLAMMELWKKHGVNPFGGCLPQLVQMPVWFAMYTTLQTATEMYHEKFLWFRDLSAPDQLFGHIGPLPALGPLPFLLGFFMILQQRIVPQQPGMDPMQQKMMTWLLPGVFTVMMLFLPAALGVYMLTNSILGIVQQLAVEKIAPRDKNEIVVTQKGSPAKKGDKGTKPPAKATAS